MFYSGNQRQGVYVCIIHLEIHTIFRIFFYNNVQLGQTGMQKH